MGKKDYGKSVKTCLFSLMSETDCGYIYLLARYFNERLSYRVPVGQYKDNFLLKGGSLLYTMNGLKTHPTVGMDFVADRISHGRDFPARVFQEIPGIVCDEGGISFSAGSIKIEPATVKKKYPSTRFYFIAHMDIIAYNMPVDIGFSDTVIPHPIAMNFPLLLPDTPSVNIQTYSLETVIAEKSRTVIDRDVLDSRMEDFFGYYQFPTKRNLNDGVLYDAIEATFDNRGLVHNPGLQLFTDSFATDRARISR